MAETGHAKNVENWQKMIAACTGFVGYKPSNANLELVAMTALLADVNARMDSVQTSIVPWKNKVADRENIYTGVRPRTTQILAAFKTGFLLGFADEAHGSVEGAVVAEVGVAGDAD